MRVVVQRCKYASCTVDGVVTGKIDKGFMILVGIKDTDTDQELSLLAKKTANLRIFEDEAGKMNKGLKDIGGDILAISQFTLYADCKHGNRPGFTEAMEFNKASAMYDKFCKLLTDEYGLKVERGIFGADMKIELLNDGPVTIILDSRDL